MNKVRRQKASLVLLLVMLVSLFATTAYAREDKATVQLFRVDKFFVIIKIVFPNDISGNFGGTLAGKHFDCVTIPPRTLICIGPFRTGPDYYTLTIYDQDTKENVLQHVVSPPPSNGQGEDQETPATPIATPVVTPPPTPPQLD